jgi:GT2 family glycosyltransferase
MIVENTLIVPVHNGSEFIHLFWTSLLTNALPNSELIIVDDGSREDLHRLVPKLPDALNAQVLRNEHPQGYARAVNRALAKTRGEYVYLLNTDLILGEGALELIHACLRGDERIGVVGAKLLYPQTGKIQHFGLAFTPTRKFHIFTHMDPGHPLVSAPREFQAVTFALCGARRRLFEEIGPLDDRFCNGCEDIDFSLRAAASGYRNVVPSAVASYHWESLSGEGARHVTTLENEARFWGRWTGRIENDIGRFVQESVRTFLAAHPHWREKSFIVVNLAPGNDSQYVRAAIESELPRHDEFAGWDYSRSARHNGQIWLAMTLPFDALRSPRPFLFLVHEYPQLLQNDYWFATRQQFCMDDLVVDHYANVLQTSGPVFRSHAARQKSVMDVS